MTVFGALNNINRNRIP